MTKKPYKTPELISYGTIQRITEAAGQMGDLDGFFTFRTGQMN